MLPIDVLKSFSLCIPFNLDFGLELCCLAHGGEVLPHGRPIEPVKLSAKLRRVKILRILVEIIFNVELPVQDLLVIAVFA